MLKSVGIPPWLAARKAVRAPIFANHLRALSTALGFTPSLSPPWLLVLRSPTAHWMRKCNLASLVQLVALTKDAGLY